MKDVCRTRPRLEEFSDDGGAMEELTSPLNSPDYVLESLQSSARYMELKKLLAADRFQVSSTRKQRLISVANRLPVTVVKDDNGVWTTRKSSGGLVAALSACEGLQMIHLGWPGADVPAEFREGVTAELVGQGCIPVYLGQDEIDLYYNGFANGVLWPLFHYVTPPLDTDSVEAEWEMYGQVNRVFSAKVVEVVKSYSDEDTLIWVHDYHLMLVPRFVRELIPNANIGWFLHTPFPSAELFRMLPYREEILQGLLSANYVGFHVPDYCSHFLAACSHLTNLPVTSSGVDAIPIGGSFVQAGVVPIGIDPNPFMGASEVEAEIAEKVAEFQQQFGNRKVILGVDRLDYMKGLEQKLRAFERFLDLHPEWRDECVLVQLAVPSRSEVKEYQKLKKHVHELVGQVCGKYSDLTARGSPVLYLDKAIGHADLAALYKVSDVMLITSIRDGMNLVAFEYIASQEGKHGVLVLSEFTGAMQSLGGGALRVNPWNLQEVSTALDRALTMSTEERQIRHAFCFDYVTKHTAQRWAETFLENLKSACTDANAIDATVPPPVPVEKLLAAWQLNEGNRRLLVLDLLDCLVASAGLSFVLHPQLATLSNETMKALESMLFETEPPVTVLITSSHRRDLMESLFGWLEGTQCSLILAPENGCVFKSFDARSTHDWTTVYPRETESTFASVEWRKALRRVIDFFQERTPGSYVEESEFSVKWFTDMRQRCSTASTLRELLLHRWAGPLSQSDAEVILADRYVEIRAKSSSIVNNITRIMSHPDTVELLGLPFNICLAMGAFPYRDDDVYQAIEEKLMLMASSRAWHVSQSAAHLLKRVSSAQTPLVNTARPSFMTDLRDSLDEETLSEMEEFAGGHPPYETQSEPAGLQSRSSRTEELADVIFSPRSRRSKSNISPFNIDYYSVSVSHTKISRARYSFPNQHHAANLVYAMSQKNVPPQERVHGA